MLNWQGIAQSGLLRIKIASDKSEVLIDKAKLLLGISLTNRSIAS